MQAATAAIELDQLQKEMQRSTLEEAQKEGATQGDLDAHMAKQVRVASYPRAEYFLRETCVYMLATSGGCSTRMVVRVSL